MSLTAHGLGKPPPKASNSSRIRARSMQNTSLKNSRNVTFETQKKKTCLSRHMALENRLRKPRTAARFVLEACKTQAWKTLETSRLESIKNMSLTAHGLGKPPAKASNSSRIRARSMQNTSLKNSRNITTHGLGKTALENCLRKPRTAAGFVVEACRTQAWKTLGTSPLESIENMSITAHGLGKPPAKAPWKTLGTSPLESMKNMFLTAHDWKTASESLEQQQDSCPKHAKHKPEKLSERHLWSPLKKKTCLSRHMALEACKTQAWKTLRTSLENSSIAMALENRLRKPRTAAGFVPEACKTQARKTLGTSPLKPIKKKHVYHGTWPWKHAKHKPEKLSERH